MVPYALRLCRHATKFHVVVLLWSVRNSCGKVDEDDPAGSPQHNCMTKKGIRFIVKKSCIPYLLDICCCGLSNDFGHISRLDRGLDVEEDDRLSTSRGEEESPGTTRKTMRTRIE